MKTIKITDDAKNTTRHLMAGLKKKFGVYSYWNDEELDKNFPKPDKKTVREFALEQESTDYKGKSWNGMANVRERMMTFREYILFFEAYHKETGNYPDEKGWTIFKNSLPDGKVARGNWLPSPFDRRVKFYWHRPDNAYSDHGARLAISLKTSTLKTDSLDLKSIKDALGHAEAYIQEAKTLLGME